MPLKRSAPQYLFRINGNDNTAAWAAEQKHPGIGVMSPGRKEILFELFAQGPGHISWALMSTAGAGNGL